MFMSCPLRQRLAAGFWAELDCGRWRAWGCARVEVVVVLLGSACSAAAGGAWMLGRRTRVCDFWCGGATVGAMCGGGPWWWLWECQSLG